MTKQCLKPNYGPLPTAPGMLKAILPLALLCCWSVTTQAQTLKPTYWKQRVFYIPYQMNQQTKLLNPIAKVQLLYSPTGANDWSSLQDAKPNVQGFSYHAPEDGEYWFALRHLDRQGRPWPNATVQPQMRIVVDTLQPEISLNGSSNVRGEVIIRYEARDANLESSSLLVEVRGSDKQWTRLRPATPDIAQPDRIVGRVPWQPPSGVSLVELRASITDKAGHRQQTTAKFDLQNSITEAGPEFPGVKKNPFLAAKQLPSQDWPNSNQLPQRTTNRNTATRQAPPLSNPYAANSQAHHNRTPAKFVGDGTSYSDRGMSKPNDSAGQSQTLGITPLDQNNAPSLAESSPWPSPSIANRKTTQESWTPTQSTTETTRRMVNSRTFDLEYDLESVGPWGVSKVELWGTQDNGHSWQSYGVDSDNRSPIRVSVPGAGVYGFRILVDGANSAGSPPPQSGDEPELTLSVDLQPPTAELLSTELGQGNLANHLLVQWTAKDTNLEPRPIALFYSSYPNGPWSTIASGIENTGNYTWRIERHVPNRFYLRLEVRDTAGNLTTFQSPTAVELARPKPTGRLSGVRSISKAQP